MDTYSGEERRRRAEEVEEERRTTAHTYDSGAGSIGLGLDGHLNMGIGGGLGIDLQDGGLELKIGGTSLDL